MPRIIHRVFVSSTFEDLREERAEVQKALLMLDCFPVGMELFAAADEETWEFIKRQIAESDYYVVIVAGKYGSIASDGVSYTEKEYDYAKEIGKPAIAFLHADTDSLPVKLCEPDPERRVKLEAFKQKIRPHPVRFFGTSHQLATEVLASIVKLRDSHPRPGFVRADEAADLKRYTELLEENVRLRAEIERNRPAVLFEGADLDFEILLSVAQKDGGRCIIGHTLTRGEAFLLIADELITGSADERNLIIAVAKGLEIADSYTGVVIQNFDKVLRTLYAFGLITYDQVHDERSQSVWGETETRIKLTHVPVRFWKLTEFGQTQYGALLARRAS